MNTEYLKGGAIMVVCFLAFVFASRKQFYQRKGSVDTYGGYVGGGCSRIFLVGVKILSILFFLYGLTMILAEKNRV